MLASPKLLSSYLQVPMAGRCLALSAASELPSLLGGANSSSDVSAEPGVELRVFYAVLTTYNNHATRCATINATWGATIPWEALVFYSDKPERTLKLNVVALADPSLHTRQLYDDAQDSHAYATRLMK
ncbi:MAG: hypothetical protein SGPRY_010127 [Prymnesium sp.]